MDWIKSDICFPLVGLSLFLFAMLLTSLVGVNHLRPKWDSPSKPGEDSRQAHSNMMGGNKKMETRWRMGRNVQHNEKYWKTHYRWTEVTFDLWLPQDEE